MFVSDVSLFSLLLSKLLGTLPTFQPRLTALPVGGSHGDSDEVGSPSLPASSLLLMPHCLHYTDIPNLMSSEPDWLWPSPARRMLCHVSHRRVLFVRAVDNN